MSGRRRWRVAFGATAAQFVGFHVLGFVDVFEFWLLWLLLIALSALVAGVFAGLWRTLIVTGGAWSAWVIINAYAYAPICPSGSWFERYPGSGPYVDRVGRRCSPDDLTRWDDLEIWLLLGKAALVFVLIGASAAALARAAKRRSPAGSDAATAEPSAGPVE